MQGHWFGQSKLQRSVAGLSSAKSTCKIRRVDTKWLTRNSDQEEEEKSTLIQTTFVGTLSLDPFLFVPSSSGRALHRTPQLTKPLNPLVNSLKQSSKVHHNLRQCFVPSGHLQAVAKLLRLQQQTNTLWVRTVCTSLDCSMRLSLRVGFLPGGHFFEISKISILYKYVVLQSSISPTLSYAEAIAQPTRLHRFCMCDRFLAAGCDRTLVLTATSTNRNAQKKHKPE